MPVYLRNAFDIPTPTISDFGENDHQDFLQDPDQRWDELPQPFRFLNKVLNSVIERAWEIANSREVERITEASKIRAPQYECGTQVKGFENATSLCNTPDGKYILLGLPSGMAAVDALNQEALSTWQHDGVEITNITSYAFDTDTYLICAIDDMGHGRLFSLANGVLFLMHNFNEDDGGTKSHVNKIEASTKGDFIGICFENPNNKENWIEFHKAPRDTWMKELESAIAKSNKRTHNTEQKPPSPTGHVEDDTAENGPILEGHTGTSEDGEKLAPDATSQASTPRAYKFTSTSLVLKVKPPTTIQGIQWSSPFQLSKTVDNGAVIGTGQNHLISSQHLDTRWSVFKALHEQHVRHLQEEEKPVLKEPTFHFLTPGKMMPFGLESPQTSEETNSVMVWWTGSNQIQHFNLVKPAKEIEHKPDLVWPTSSHIVATAVTKCTSLIAVAMASGVVTVWDKYLGMKRRTVNVQENIVQLEFLDPSVCPQEESSYPPYTTSTNCYVLVRCKDDSLFLVNCGLGCDTPASDVSTTLNGTDDRYTQLTAINGIPELMVSCRVNGRIYIHNIITSDVLCEVVIPNNYEVFNPWQPIIALGGQGQLLYIRGKLRPSYETGVTPSEGETLDKDGLFVFQLNTIPTLEKYRTHQRPSIPYSVHYTVEARVDALFRERIAQQTSRKSRMQDRWDHLKDELQLIKELTAKPSQPKIRTSLFATGQH